MPNPSISVIVPVYNMEKHLSKCLDSIAIQTFTDFEAIFINDGSTDNSADILKTYCKKYSNFKLIEQANSGVCAARNNALVKATGDFVAFIDSDDFIAKNFLERLYNEAIKSNASITVCNYMTHIDKYNKSRPYPLKFKRGLYENPKALRALIYDTRLHHHIWNKLFKRSLLTGNNITFPDMCFEDMEFTVKAFYFAEKISVINDPLYYYVRHDDSTLSTINASKINHYLIASAMTRAFLQQKNDFSSYKFSFLVNSIRTFCITSTLIFSSCSSKNNYRSFFRNLKKALYLIYYCNSKNFNPSSFKKLFNLED